MFCQSEIELALSVGSKPSDIIYAHPCKKPSYIRYNSGILQYHELLYVIPVNPCFWLLFSFAAKRGVSMMTFDSKEELFKIKELYPNAEYVQTQGSLIFLLALVSDINALLCLLFLHFLKFSLTPDFLKTL